VPVFRTAAPFVRSVVAAKGGELIDQISFRSHDLDAVEAGIAGIPGSLGKILDGLQDLIGFECAGRVAIDRRTDVRWSDAVLLARIAARMQDLGADQPAFTVYGFDDWRERCRLGRIVEPGAAGFEEPGFVR